MESTDTPISKKSKYSNAVSFGGSTLDNADASISNSNEEEASAAEIAQRDEQVLAAASLTEEVAKRKEEESSAAEPEKATGWRSATVGATEGKTPRAETELASYFEKLEARSAEEELARAEAAKEKPKQLPVKAEKKDVGKSGDTSREDVETVSNAEEAKTRVEKPETREECLLLAAELIGKKNPEDTARAIEILQDYKDDREVIQLLERLDKLRANQEASGSADEGGGTVLDKATSFFGKKGEDGFPKKKLAIIGAAVLAVLVIVVAAIVLFSGEKIPEDAYKVSTSIGNKFTTADSLRNDLIETAADHFCDSAHNWKVTKSTVEKTGTQKFHIKADLTDTFEKTKDGSNGTIKTVTTYNRKIETDVLLSGSDATFYNFEITKDEMSSKDEEIKSAAPSPSSSAGSSSSSSSGGSSSSKSYSSSKTKCHLCGGSGRVKYYSGGAGSDYTWGTCTACNGTGYE